MTSLGRWFLNATRTARWWGQGNEGLEDSKAFVPLRAIAVLRECMERRGFTEEEIAEAVCKRYYDDIIVWTRTRGRAPGSLEEMASPLNPEEENFIRLEDDPWGNLYVLETPGEGVLVRSFGPDGKRGPAVARS